MSDTWSNIQAHKKQLDSLRERLQRRRKDPTQLSAGAFTGLFIRMLDLFMSSITLTSLILIVLGSNILQICSTITTFCVMIIISRVSSPVKCNHVICYVYIVISAK